jgi:cytochrome c oxidase subunit II
MTVILGVIVLVCVLLVILYVGRTVELTAELKGTIDDTEKSSNINGFLLLGFLILFFMGIGWSSTIFLPRMLPSAASKHGMELDKLFNITLFFTGIVFVVTQILLFWFAFRYRERKNAKSYFFPHSNMMELIWTAIPAVVMLVLVAKGMITWFDIFPSEKDMPKDKLTIEVTAQQFKWTFRYPGPDGEFGRRIIDEEHVKDGNDLGIDWTDPASHDDFFTDTLYFVKDKPVLVKLNALDVLHSFYLPHFRVKMDCVPGVPTRFFFIPTQTTEDKRKELSQLPEWQKINEATGQPRWQTFMYELACAELCGRSHFGMQRYVMVVNQSQYDLWAKQHKAAYDPTKTAGDKPAADSGAVKEASTFDLKLADGTAMKGAVKEGVENNLITFIEDKTKMVDKTTWFSFDRLTFETAKATLMPESSEQLANVAAIMKAHPEVEVKIGGYTDNVGDAAKIMTLSNDRAKSVMAELVKLGVDEKRMKAEGYGDQFPVGDNKTEEGRAKNRRIDIRVTKK